MVTAAENRRGGERLVAINIRRLNPRMRTLFKSWCARRDISMEQALIQFIEAAVAGELPITITPVGHLR